jgi:hypothetical protein
MIAARAASDLAALRIRGVACISADWHRLFI